MKTKSLLVLTVSLLLFTSASLHKFYVSVTQIEYVEEQKSLQVISRIFIDDLEMLLRERYDETITLAVENEKEIAQKYIQRYVADKFVIMVDGISIPMTYIGREYEDDIIYIYLEIENLTEINSMEIKNEILFDLYPEQQNIVRTKIFGKHKSFILIKENAKGVLNFN